MSDTLFIVGSNFQAVGLTLYVFFLFTFFCITAALTLLASKWYYRKLASFRAKNAALNSDRKKSAEHFGGDVSDVSISGPTLQQKGQALLSILIFLFFAFLLVPEFFLFHTVVVRPSGEWVLKNAWSIPIGKIPAEEERNLEVWKIEKTFTKSYRKVTAFNLNIVTPKKIYRSLDEKETNLNEISDALARDAEERGVLASPERREGIYPYIKYIRLVIIGIGVFIGWWFWRGEKKK